jgi:hypothetical protein
MAVVMATAGGAAFVFGQSPPKSAPEGSETLRTSYGHPALEGFWAPAESGVPFAAAPFTPPPPRQALPRIGWGVAPGQRAERPRPNRAALIVDPPDGKVPAYTSEGRKRMDALIEYRRQHDNGNIYDSWEDVGLYSRCMTRGVPGSVIAGSEAGGGLHIIQGPEAITILPIALHEVRVIPLANVPHAPASVRTWLGDSRGRWEGNSLVVDVTNFRSPLSFTGSPWETDYIPVTEKYHVVERFTRIDAETLEYRATIDDPGTFTRPFTILVKFRPDREAEEIYEDACHEGNRGLEGILSASRAVERKKAAGGGQR